MRLIDADALELGKFVEARTDWHKGWNEALEGAAFAAPTIDAVEVVHGRWIKKTADCIYYYACSECGEPVLRSQWGCDFFSEFCPNCGAKMDREREDE